MAKSLNKAILIGNLTRDPELKYTPQGTAVCTFGIATNRQWVTDAGEKKDEADFHNIVAWAKLAEICSQLLTKGRKVYVEGRLQTRTWQAQDGAQRSRTEIVISDMIVLDPKQGGAISGAAEEFNVPEAQVEEVVIAKDSPVKVEKKAKETKKDADVEAPVDEEIPF